MTHTMLKGSNVPLDATAVRTVLCWTPGTATPDVDVSALLVGPDGQVRSDEDFVFYNQPRHPSGLVRHLPKKRVEDGLTDTIEADLAGLDPSVDQVVIAASSDGDTFACVPDLRILLFDAAADPSEGAEPLALFEVRPETGEETAIICGELYRRGDSWKFRAVAQGYPSGLIGLATAFGISVDEEESADGADDAEPAGDPWVDAGADAEAQAGADTAGEPAPDPEPEPEPEAEPEAEAEVVPDSAAPDLAPVPEPGQKPDDVTAAIPAPPLTPPPPAPAVPPAPTAPPAYGYPQAATTGAPQPAYGYPQPTSAQPAYGYPHPYPAPAPAPAPAPVGAPVPDPHFQLPPMGPQFMRP